jgi:copper(I)-binding protein
MTGPLGSARIAVLTAFLACLGTSSAAAADIALKNAWMLPARSGAAKAEIYVDIRTDIPLKLVGATSPLAKWVAFVLVDRDPDGSVAETAVTEIDLPGGKETRFAYGGDRLELRDVAQDLFPGASVPLTLRFFERPDKTTSVEIDVLVRSANPAPEQPGAKPG